MHRRRSFGSLLLLVAAVTASMVGMPGSAAAAPPAPEILQWAVDGKQVFVDYSYPADRAGNVLRFETVFEVEGQPTQEREWSADTRWLSLFSGQAVDGSQFTLSLRAVDAAGPGSWLVIEGELGGRFAEAPTELVAESRGEEDVIALSWTPPVGVSDPAYEVRVSLAVRGPEDVQTFVVDEPRIDVPHSLGLTPGSFTVRALTESGYGFISPTVEFVYEDQWPAPVTLQLKPRAGGFFVFWQNFKQSHKLVGAPDSWLVEVDGRPAPFQITRTKQENVKGFVRGLTDGTEHEVTVRGVTELGPGLPISATGRTFAAAEQMGAPRAEPGKPGGERTVVVSWSTPEWGGAAPCCFRVTAVGRGFDGKKMTIRRFADADVRSMDFGVGSKGPWRFAIEAKTGTGFSPVSAYSGKVRAR